MAQHLLLLTTEDQISSGGVSVLHICGTATLMLVCGLCTRNVIAGLTLNASFIMGRILSTKMDELKVTALYSIVHNGGENRTGGLKKVHFMHFSVRP